jgi:hypothetical protein
VGVDRRWVWAFPKEYDEALRWLDDPFFDWAQHYHFSKEGAGNKLFGYLLGGFSWLSTCTATAVGGPDVCSLDDDRAWTCNLHTIEDDSARLHGGRLRLVRDDLRGVELVLYRGDCHGDRCADPEEIHVSCETIRHEESA